MLFYVWIAFLLIVIVAVPVAHFLEKRKYASAVASYGDDEFAPNEVEASMQDDGFEQVVEPVEEDFGGDDGFGQDPMGDDGFGDFK